MKTNEIFDAGYAVPAYTILGGPFRLYRFRGEYFYSSRQPETLFDLPFPVVEYSAAKALEVSLETARNGWLHRNSGGDDNPAREDCGPLP